MPEVAAGRFHCLLRTATVADARLPPKSMVSARAMRKNRNGRLRGLTETPSF